VIIARWPEVGAAEHREDGTTTVDFGGPAYSSPSEPTISREPPPAATGAPSSSASWTSASPSSSQRAAPMIGAHRGHEGPNIDEIYNQVVERLARDFLVERERNGDFLGDLP